MAFCGGVIYLMAVYRIINTTTLRSSRLLPAWGAAPATNRALVDLCDEFQAAVFDWDHAISQDAPPPEAG